MPAHPLAAPAPSTPLHVQTPLVAALLGQPLARPVRPQASLPLPAHGPALAQPPLELGPPSGIHSRYGYEVGARRPAVHVCIRAPAPPADLGHDALFVLHGRGPRRRAKEAVEPRRVVAAQRPQPQAPIPHPHCTHHPPVPHSIAGHLQRRSAPAPIHAHIHGPHALLVADKTPRRPPVPTQVEVVGKAQGEQRRAPLPMLAPPVQAAAASPDAQQVAASHLSRGYVIAAFGQGAHPALLIQASVPVRPPPEQHPAPRTALIAPRRAAQGVILPAGAIPQALAVSSRHPRRDAPSSVAPKHQARARAGPQIADDPFGLTPLHCVVKRSKIAPVRLAAIALGQAKKRLTPDRHDLHSLVQLPLLPSHLSPAHPPPHGRRVQRPQIVQPLL